MQAGPRHRCGCDLYKSSDPVYIYMSDGDTVTLLCEKNVAMSLRNAHDERAQWLSGKVLDSRPRGRGFEPHQRHCIVSLSKGINPSLVLVQPRKICPFITERLLMRRKESNQTNKTSMTMLYHCYMYQQIQNVGTVTMYI